jgi:hypothetical protein
MTIDTSPGRPVEPVDEMPAVISAHEAISDVENQRQ